MPREDGWFKGGDDPRRMANARTGAKTRITTKFLEAFANDFEEHGAEAIQACRLTDPVKYVQIAAALIPKDISLADADGNAVGFIIVPAKNGTEASVETNGTSNGVPASH